MISLLDPSHWYLITHLGYTYTEQEFGGIFYKLHDPMNWHDGKRKCESEYTKMAVPKSDEENQFIANLAPGKESVFTSLFNALE